MDCLFGGNIVLDSSMCEDALKPCNSNIIIIMIIIFINDSSKGKVKQMVKCVSNLTIQGNNKNYGFTAIKNNKLITNML